MAGNLGEKICVTRTDLEALLGLVEARRGLSPRDQAHLDALEQELGRADVVEPAELPHDVVSLRSKVRVKDLANGQVRDYTLVPPREADVAAGRLSILAPIGTALLGYRQGDVVEWTMPGGPRRLQVLKVLFQPEAAASRGA